MKHTALIAAIALSTLAACDKDPGNEPFVPPAQTMPMSAPSSSTLPPGHPAIGNNEAPMPAATDDESEVVQTEQATVLSTIEIEGFTFIEVKQHTETRWLASKSIKLNKGDTVSFDSGSTMENFKSKVLDRTFPSMTFVNKVSVVKGK